MPERVSYGMVWLWETLMFNYRKFDFGTRFFRNMIYYHDCNVSTDFSSPSYISEDYEDDLYEEAYAYPVGLSESIVDAGNGNKYRGRAARNRIWLGFNSCTPERGTMMLRHQINMDTFSVSNITQAYLAFYVYGAFFITDIDYNSQYPLTEMKRYFNDFGGSGESYIYNSSESIRYSTIGAMNTMLSSNFPESFYHITWEPYSENVILFKAYIDNILIGQITHDYSSRDNQFGFYTLVSGYSGLSTLYLNMYLDNIRFYDTVIEDISEFNWRNYK